MATTSAHKTTTTSNARNGAAKSKVTTDPTATAAKSSRASDAPKKAPKVSLIDLLTEHAPDASSAADLAKRVGVADDEAFRRAITHHSQGRRALAEFREKLIREDDSRVYVERRAAKVETEKAEA